MIRQIDNIIRNKSVKCPLTVFFLILITVLLGFGFVTYITQNKQSRQFAEFTQVMETLSGLSLDINQSQYKLDHFFKTGEQDYYISYVPVSLEISEKIGFLKKKFLNTDYALDIRIIENINDFCISSISNYLTPQENNPDIYARQQFVIKAFSVMNNYIGSLLSVYISKEGVVFQETMMDQKRIHNSMIISFLILIIITFVVAFYVLKKIIAQLDTMVRHAEELTEASWQIADLPENSIKELNTLSRAMNLMKKSLNEYFIKIKHNADLEIRYRKERQENAEKSKLLFKARYQMLAKRLDPHFLFNALNIVYRKCMFSGQQHIMDIVSALANVLRYNIEIDREFVPLEQELKVFDSYMYIHKLRFDEKLTVIKKIDCELSRLFIAPFLLQTLIETILSNTAGYSSNNRSIEISITENDNDKTVKIEIIYSAEKIETGKIIYSNTNIIPDDLSTLKERLKIIYHEKAVLSETADAGSKRIILVIPVKVGSYV